MGSSALLADDHWNGSGDWGGLLLVPSVDEMQEFKVLTNTFNPSSGFGDPAFGRILQAMPARSIQFGIKLNW